MANMATHAMNVSRLLSLDVYRSPDSFVRTSPCELGEEDSEGEGGGENKVRNEDYPYRPGCSSELPSSPSIQAINNNNARSPIGHAQQPQHQNPLVDSHRSQSSFSGHEVQSDFDFDNGDYYFYHSDDNCPNSNLDVEKESDGTCSTTTESEVEEMEDGKPKLTAIT
ncbi:hypothetical protein I203_104647 [Kwoniella mangroviensis CBS 8507]|uniref:uncharacterized protein n=1 Tax=Kwoniella mangroviensis CBS 8507 TaxID=1296122 RepID=UPI003066A9EE